MPAIVEKTKLLNKSGSVVIPSNRRFLTFTIENGEYYLWWVRNTNITTTITRQYVVYEDLTELPNLGVLTTMYYYNQDEEKMHILTIFSV